MENFLTSDEMKTLVKVSLGQSAADLIITGGELVNVYSGELLKNVEVAIKGDRIAYIGSDARRSVGPHTRHIDASGKILIPGLIDAHTHMSYCTPDEFVGYAMKGGTTTIITEVLKLSFSLGYSGISQCLEALQDQPIKLFATVPSLNTLSRRVGKKAPSIKQRMELLHKPQIVGVGESYWQEVIRCDSNLPTLFSQSLRLGKTVEGHAAGCRAEKLSAYISCGVSSCHESVRAEEVLEKLRMGLWVMIREGSVRRDLDEIARIKDMPVDFRRLVLVSDGFYPGELIRNGYMESLVQRTIDAGFNPIVAIQMATLNPAEHFGLDGILGGISPGKYADIVIIPDLHSIRAEYVISNGNIVARDGEVCVRPRKVNFPHQGHKRLNLDPSDFTVRIAAEKPVKVRVIDQVTGLVTREAFVDIVPKARELKADPEQDLLKVSLVSWEGRIFNGFIRGHGFKKGAMATSCAWDTFAITTVGANADDMAGATNRVCDLQGGIVIYSEGKILAELPLPVGGMISNLPIEEIAQKVENIRSVAKRLGFRYEDAAMTLATLTTPAIPFLRISEDGLVDVKTGNIVDLIVC